MWFHNVKTQKSAGGAVWGTWINPEVWNICTMNKYKITRKNCSYMLLSTPKNTYKLILRLRSVKFWAYAMTPLRWHKTTLHCSEAPTLTSHCFLADFLWPDIIALCLLISCEQWSCSLTKRVVLKCTGLCWSYLHFNPHNWKKDT